VTEEEGEYEYVSYKQGAESGKDEAQVEDGVLYQPLNSEEAGKKFFLAWNSYDGEKGSFFSDFFGMRFPKRRPPGQRSKDD
jgi:hypothetical protein